MDDAHQQPHADLILAQGNADWSAGLLTIFPGRNVPSFELAASLPPLLSGYDLVRIGQAEFWLHNAHCRTTHGWHEIPFDERAHPSADGQSFVIAFTSTTIDFGAHPQVEDPHDVSSFMATVHQQPHSDVSPIAERSEAATQEMEYIQEEASPSSGEDDYELRKKMRTFHGSLLQSLTLRRTQHVVECPLHLMRPSSEESGQLLGSDTMMYHASFRSPLNQKIFELFSSRLC